jgi:hypothetical protein
MSEETSIGISKKLQKRLKLISLYTNKKLYEVIEEAATILEEKYHVQQIGGEENHE